MEKSRIVAIGCSTGGIEALKTLMGTLTPDFPAPILVVQHIAPESPGFLPEILARAGRLPVTHGADDEQVHPGRVYIAPPNHHMMVQHTGVIRLSQGARENRVRPAIDPLFRSVAVGYGTRAIGVIMTGALDDGTAGLAAIKSCGGLAVVQDPADAVNPSMPKSALRHVAVDHVVPLSGMAALLQRLAEAPPPPDLRDMPAMRHDLETEVRLGAGEASVAAVAALGEPSLLTCPECHGSLVKLRDKAMLRYRCHTGHAFTAATLVAALQESSETSLWSTIRVFQESAILLRHLARHCSEAGLPDSAGELMRQAEVAQKRVDALKAIQATEAPF